MTDADLIKRAAIFDERARIIEFTDAATFKRVREHLESEARALELFPVDR